MTRGGDTRGMDVFLALVTYAAAGVLVFLSLPVTALVALVLYPFDRDRRAAGRLLRLFSAAIGAASPLWSMGIEGELPAKKPFIAVANHTSIIDVFLLSRLPCEMKWMVKMSLWRLPWVGWALRVSGDIPVVRGDRESGQGALAKARRYLRRGLPVMVFPEGTRSREGGLGPFKLGAFALAAELGVPVVPIAIDGAADGMPADSPWIRRARPRARILAPVAPQGRGPGEPERLCKAAREQIARALGQELREAA